MDADARRRAEVACGCRDCFALGGIPWPKGDWPDQGCWADRLMVFAADAVAQAVKKRDVQIQALTEERNALRFDKPLDIQLLLDERREQAEEIARLEVERLRLTKGWQDEARLRVQRDEEVARLQAEVDGLKAEKTTYEGECARLSDLLILAPPKELDVYTKTELAQAVRAERERCAQRAGSFFAKSIESSDIPAWEHGQMIAEALRREGETSAP